MESTYLNEIQKAPFLFLKDHPWDYFKPVSDTLDKSTNGNLCDEETFFKTFMSELNIQYINAMIKKTVYNNRITSFRGLESSFINIGSDARTAHKNKNNIQSNKFKYSLLL